MCKSYLPFLMCSKLIVHYVSEQGQGLGIGVVCLDLHNGERGIFVEDIAKNSPAHSDGQVGYVLYNIDI